MRTRARCWAALTTAPTLIITLAPAIAQAQELEPIIVVDQGAGSVVLVVDESTSIPLATDLVNPRGVGLAADESLLVVAEAGPTSSTSSRRR